MLGPWGCSIDLLAARELIASHCLATHDACDALCGASSSVSTAEDGSGRTSRALGVTIAGRW